MSGTGGTSPWLVSFTAGVTIATVSVGGTQPAEASVSFNRLGALYAAADYYDQPHTSWPLVPYCWHHSWCDVTYDAGNNCTNFVSRVWNYGGQTHQNPSWYSYKEWGFHLVSPPWVNVGSFSHYHDNDHWQNGSSFADVWAADKTSPVTSALTGDAFWYNWGDGGSEHDHLAMYVGTQYVYDWFNEYNMSQKIHYNSNVDMLAQQTVNRFAAPWNIGYWLDKLYGSGSTNWQRQVFKVIHVNT